MSIIPDYDQIEAALGSVGQAASVAAAHGALSGMLSAGGVQAGHAWIQELLCLLYTSPSPRDS